MRERLSAMGLPLTPELDELVTASPRHAIEAVLDWLDERGGAAAYLLAEGLSAAELEQLRARLTTA